jgi:hypothetical protein
MKPQKFEDFLKDWHAEQYTGTDDDMPDAFDDWLGDLESESWINLGDVFAEKQRKELTDKH